jgi:hypothetical protein
MTAVATTSPGWHSNDDQVVIDSDNVGNDDDAFAVRELLACSRCRLSGAMCGEVCRARY